MLLVEVVELLWNDSGLSRGHWQYLAAGQPHATFGTG
jgi:hypothetical protein